MIPLIQKEIESNGWLSPSEFVDIIAVAEMTPGPIAVNSATFVGYKTAGFLGGAIATVGVAIPSLVLILFISKYFFKFQKHPVNTAVFYGIRPVITGLIITAAVLVAETSILKVPLSTNIFKNLLINPFSVIDIGSIGVLVATLIVLMKFKIHPILVIIGSGVMGIVLFYIF
ncbi:chromate transporter [Natronincola ferrireducens]|uniref:Chromate transporter n=1 Tax=Natronincola ferrireducens TaxID=393762 RepID=A0A1G9GW65_9FIRM|nr:chromate transporter [Natronincola ferrireducens]SDL04906.1 chromate transporter [Natronincola ferrireducens]